MKKNEILKTIDKFYSDAKEKATFYREMSEKYPNEEYWKRESEIALNVWYALFELRQEINNKG